MVAATEQLGKAQVLSRHTSTKTIDSHLASKAADRLGQYAEVSMDRDKVADMLADVFELLLATSTVRSNTDRAPEIEALTPSGTASEYGRSRL